MGNRKSYQNIKRCQVKILSYMSFSLNNTMFIFKVSIKNVVKEQIINHFEGPNLGNGIACFGNMHPPPHKGVDPTHVWSTPL